VSRNEEIIRVGKVMNHPAFMSNPLETIKTHLQNSIAAKHNARRGPGEM
jgi:hypothetical protein